MKRITLTTTYPTISARTLFVAAFAREFHAIEAAELISEDALAHVASIFAPPIEDDTWLLAMPAPRSSERWYDWIV